MKTFTQISKFAAMAAMAAIGISLYACEEKEKASKPTGQYKSVKIGNQTWMAENLNIETPDSWCYENKPENCQKYGRLYTWEAAKKACPSGWHLPSKDEWQTLVDFAGGNETAGTKLKAVSGWKSDYCEEYGEMDNFVEKPCPLGTDDFGFAALPGGEGSSDGKFSNVGTDGNWWGSTEYADDYADNLRISYHIEYAFITNSSYYAFLSRPNLSLYSIRCIKS
jgi:uncharacterized protein (TIGR02145 family)